ncbi:hypothetical protein DFH06DRAFT_457096 [Mycena polygramma]|nr:hypothetical protein DFH06DRAFT_457096 [Mycena polygramma]
MSLSSVETTVSDLFAEIAPSPSEEIARKLLDPAVEAFEEARELYYQGKPGPFALTGNWSQATYEALVDRLECHWNMAWNDGQITLYGDPGPVHQSIIYRLTTMFSSAVSDWILKHPDAPAAFGDAIGQMRLYGDHRSAGRCWKLTPSSPSPVIKEPDAFFRMRSREKTEAGVAFEIAHLTESLPVLCGEVVDWTSGDGDRALLGVGLKIQSETPGDADPKLRFVVRDVSPTALSNDLYYYDFGAGSSVSGRANRSSGPASQTTEVAREDMGRCRYIGRAPVNDNDSFIVDIPAGAALFSSLSPTSFPRVPLTPDFVAHMRSFMWKLDLSHLRYSIISLVERHGS